MNTVGIFWDYENCAPPAAPPGTPWPSVSVLLVAYMVASCSSGYLELTAPHSALATPSSTANTPVNPEPSPLLPTSPKTLVLRSELQSSGVSLIDCPHDSRKNVADAMLACDLVCFALDHPTTPSISYPSLIPSSPYSIPSTPFSYVSAPPISPPKTTVVLVSGDRDFAYPLAVLKARRYEVGLIIPPGGAHPALRAQASWVLNWKDVMEDAAVHAEARGDLNSNASVNPSRSAGQASNANGTASTSNQPTEHRANPRRSSFASRRGSVSGSRRGSISSSSPAPPLPPPPPPAESGSSRAPNSSSTTTHNASTSSPIPRPPLPPLPPDEPSPQLPPTPKMSRRSSLRRIAKAGSRPPSRSRSRLGTKNTKPEVRTEQATAGASRSEQKRPQPTIIPVPLTSSPVGPAGPSFAAMSPQGQGRPHTPPLFSTHPVSPPPPAAPPALAPPPTPPVKASTPSVKPPTPPRDTSRPPHRPSIPHEPSTVSKPGNEDLSTGLDIPPVTSALQSLVPPAPALRPTSIRPPLTVVAPVANSSTLTPATPVTPPASPPFRPWARLQPVNDETDGDGDQVASKRTRKGKERSRDSQDAASREPEEHQRRVELEQHKIKETSDMSEEPIKLVVDVAMAIKSSCLPSAISGVDSILRSYSERTPNADYEGQLGHFGRPEVKSPLASHSQAPTLNAGDETEDEEKFDESFFASLARSPPTVNAARTPGTIKALLLDLIAGEGGAPESYRLSHSSTPRPLQRTHSLPSGTPTIQSLLAGSKRNSLDAHIELLESVARVEIGTQSDDSLRRVYSRVGSPAVPPPLVHRNTLPSTNTVSINTSALGLSSNPSVDSTYKEFRPLIDVLERLRRDGNDCPLRSLIGSEFSRDVFTNAGVSSFREYVNRASQAGVVEVGGGSVQGREWISLSRHWRGMCSGFE
ncbi:NYN domain protein [Ceratobasidium sp. AG-Ba]|nr:NYN domain protein [Ceratobasidium sp. AG-Ba]